MAWLANAAFLSKVNLYLLFFFNTYYFLVWHDQGAVIVFIVCCCVEILNILNYLCKRVKGEWWGAIFIYHIYGNNVLKQTNEAMKKIMYLVFVQESKHPCCHLSPKDDQQAGKELKMHRWNSVAYLYSQYLEIW